MLLLTFPHWCALKDYRTRHSSCCIRKLILTHRSKSTSIRSWLPSCPHLPILSLTRVSVVRSKFCWSLRSIDITQLPSYYEPIWLPDGKWCASWSCPSWLAIRPPVDSSRISQVPTFTVSTCHALRLRKAGSLVDFLASQCCLRFHQLARPFTSQLSLGALSLKGVISPNGLQTLCLRFTSFVTSLAQGSIFTPYLQDVLSEIRLVKLD